MGAPDRQNAEPGRGAGHAQVLRHTLSKALSIAESIKKNNAGRPFSRGGLATSLGLSSGGSGFRQLIISSGRYGLTTGGYQADRIALSALGRSIVEHTSDEERAGGLLKALRAGVLGDVIDHYDGNYLPREDLLKNALTRTFNVSPKDVDVCYRVFMANAEEYGLLEDGADGQKLAYGAPAPGNPGGATAAPAPAGVPGGPPPQAERPGPGPRGSFLVRSGNPQLLDQIRRILEFGGLGCREAAAEEAEPVPIPGKTFDAMRACDGAVIDVGPGGRDGDEGGVSGDAMIEIGAAFLHYDKRVVLLLERGADLPPNLGGLRSVEYEGGRLDGDGILALQDELLGLRGGARPGPSAPAAGEQPGGDGEPAARP